MKNIFRTLFIIITLYFCNIVYSQNITGTGTKLDPYLIYTPIGLDSIRYLQTASISDTNMYFQLHNDLDMSSITNFIPIGNLSAGFYANFDGQNYTISNLHLVSVNANGCGLFGNPTDGLLQNLIMNNCSSNIVLPEFPAFGEKSIGIFCGYADDMAHLRYIRIKNSQITVTGNNYYLDIGILAGKALGWAYRCSVENCTINETSGTNAPYVNNVGLLIGWAQGMDVQQCFATGRINVVKPTNNNLTACLFIGKSGNTEAGWLKKNNYAIGYCNSSDGVSFTTDGLDSLEYTVDTLITSTLKFGFNWRNNSAYIPNNSTCYFDSSAAGTSIANNTLLGTDGVHTIPANVRNKTQLRTKANFVGWDFVNIWAIKSNVNDGYPYLINNPPNIPALVSKRLRIRK